MGEIFTRYFEIKISGLFVIIAALGLTVPEIDLRVRFTVYLITIISYLTVIFRNLLLKDKIDASLNEMKKEIKELRKEIESLKDVNK